MKIIVEFESMDEFEAFRSSAKKTRGRPAKADVEEAEEVAETAVGAPASPSPAPVTVTPTPPPAAFAPAPIQPSQGFPGGNGSKPAVHPLVAAMLMRIDSAISSGQSADNIVAWFREQIGAKAANATLDQIRHAVLPSMSEAELKVLAPALGIQG